MTDTLPMSAEDTLGPYYPMWFTDAYPCDLTVARRGTVCHPRGQRIVLHGRLLDKHSEVIPAALVELWQANADGRYRTPDNEGDATLDPHFHGFGRLHTSEEPWVYRTIKPGIGSAGRAPHLCVTIFCDGISRVRTQVFFDDEAEANTRDPLLQSLPEELRGALVARRSEDDSDDDAIHYEVDIVLSGENETPFFDDLLAPGETEGRTLRAGDTDMAADARVPSHPLRPIPDGLLASFAPCYPPPPGLPAGEDDLTRLAPGRPQADGEPARVQGRVTDEKGNPLAGVLLEIWNANPHGRYTHIHDPAEQPLDPLFYGFGRVLTNEAGEFSFQTIRPGAYLARADIGRYRPAHVHFSLIARQARLVTQMYFEGDPHLERDPAYQVLGDSEMQQRQVAKSTDGGDGGVPVYRFDIVMQNRLTK